MGSNLTGGRIAFPLKSSSRFVEGLPPCTCWIRTRKRSARVNIDYHIQAAGHCYSVPHAPARRQVDVRLSAMTVEIFHKHRRVATHVRARRIPIPEARQGLDPCRMASTSEPTPPTLDKESIVVRAGPKALKESADSRNCIG